MDRVWPGPKGLHVEPAEPGDAERLASLHAQGFFRGWPQEDFAAYIAAADTAVYVACDARRRIAGFAMVRLAADEAELVTIAVDPRWRGKRIGGALMAALLTDLRTTPAKTLFLEVATDAPAALRLYAGLGFVEIGRRQGYYPRPDGQAATALVMSRDLG